MAQFSGGYDCKFVEKPPTVVQSECPVCLQILREPYQVDCCGYAFCQVCIHRVKVNNQPCPCCKAEKFNKFEDKRLKQILHDFKVYCTHNNQGCKWTGELKQLHSHLNVNPSKEKQLEGCQFTEIKCLHCSQVAQRYDVRVHQSEECPKRPFKCEYCRNVDSTYEEISTNHWPVCDYYPQLCPNNCGETVQRQGLDNHIANDCSMTVVDCDFKHIGCETRLPCKLMKVHLTNIENIARHLSQQVAYQGIEMAKLKEENKKLTQQVAKLTQDLQDMQVRTTLYPVEFTINNFEKYQTNNKPWLSPPFYTHQNEPADFSQWYWLRMVHTSVNTN